MKNKLDDLVERNILNFYVFVQHYPEDDQEKEHFHCYFVPNGQYQTDQLKPYLNEFDPTNTKPRSILPCDPSKFDDWYLYSCHDPIYLASKGQARQFIYAYDDFISSSNDYFHELVGRVDFAKYRRSKEMYDAIKSGATLEELLERGQVPIPQFNAFKSFYDTIVGNTVYRNGKPNPLPKTLHAVPRTEDDPFS